MFNASIEDAGNQDDHAEEKKDEAGGQPQDGFGPVVQGTAPGNNFQGSGDGIGQRQLPTEDLAPHVCKMCVLRSPQGAPINAATLWLQRL